MYCRWEFGVDSHDIKFSILKKDEEGNESIVHGPRKVSEGPVDVGVLPVNGPATCKNILELYILYVPNTLPRTYYRAFFYVHKKSSLFYLFL